MKNTLGLIVILSLIILNTHLLRADPLQAGNIAPDFSVISGDGQYLTLEQLRGKVIVMFYNSKDTSNQDSDLRKVLNRFYDEQPGEIKAKVFKLAIIDCSSAFFPIDLIWKHKLIEASRQKRMVIYGDWNGKIAEIYGFNTDAANFVIIDKDGVIRFIARKEITDEKEIKKIVALLNQLT